MGECTYIRKNQPRVEGMEKVTGRALFTTEINLPGQLVGKVLTSTVPSAIIKKIDIEQARALPGVVAIITGQDFNGLFGPCIEDRPILARDRVRFFGEPVAAVAAENEQIAAKALRLIAIEYEPLPFVTDELEALASDAPLLHPLLGDYDHVAGTTMPEPGTNACQHFRLRKGEVESALAEADFVLSGKYHIAPTYHASLEPRVAIACYDNGANSLEMWCSNQSPYVLQRMLSKLFDIPRNRLRIHIPWLGGGFGCKIYPTIEPIAVALAIKAGGRPVKLQLSRREDFLSGTSHGATIKLTTGVNKDGKIIARKVEAFFNTGAYADCGPLVARNGGYPGAGPYNIPNLSVDSYAIYTNLPVATAFRGYGIPQVTWPTRGTWTT
jgi:CO/xanthine dehydrogenase Mo-binding subunit